MGGFLLMENEPLGVNVMSRTQAHVIEDRSVDAEKKIMQSNSSILVRALGGHDYDCDFLVELFENSNVTGKIAFLQIKGTDKTITPLIKKPEIISCRISESCARYAMQKRIPLVLALISLKNEKFFYYSILQDDESILKKQIKGGVQTYISIEKTIEINSTFELINDINKFYSHTLK